MKLWTNGFFHTLENESDVHHHMITQDGHIVCLGDEALNMPYTEVLDLNHGHVYPGFVDAHMHLLGYGQMLSRPNLTGVKDKDRVIKQLIEHFRSEALFAEGYFECGLTKHDLNKISTETPIMVRHNDYHSLTVNDAVLNQMHLQHDTGILTEAVAQQAMDTFPKYTHEGLKTLLIKAIESLYRYGITGAHSDDLYYFNGFFDTIKAFEEVLEHYPFRAHLLMHHHTVKDFIKSNRPFLDQHKYLQLGAVKMFYDGTLSSKTALMVYPYKDSEDKGLNVNGYETFVSYVQMARSYHLPVAIHVIGDQGLEEVLDILEKYPPKEGVYDRLIHTPWVKKGTLERLKQMHLTTDIQPQFLSSDLPWALSYMSKTPDLIFPWKSLLETGINLAGSSDAPVETPNPLLGMYAAIERVSDHDHKTYQPEEKLTRYEALKLYTTYANYSTQKKNRGLLKEGFVCDLTVFEQDLLHIPIQKFKTNPVLMTVVDEHIVYKKEI